MYVEKSTKTVYQDRQPYTAPDGTQYPRNYPKDEIHGLVKVKETPRPEGKIVSGFTINNKFEQVWTARDKTREEKTEELAAHLPKYRNQKVNGGLTVNGVTIQTDAESRANLLGAKELGTSIKWKTPDGFVELTSDQIAAIAVAVGQHVQKCFNTEAALDPSDYDTIEELETAFNTAMEA